MKRVLIIIHLVIVVMFGTYIYLKYFRYQKEAVPQAVSIDQMIVRNTKADLLKDEFSQEKTASSSIEAATSGGTAMSVSVKLPDELNLDLPFYPQAPYANWDLPWQETCEEASVLLVANAYYKHNWTLEQFNDELLKLVEWEKDKFGDYKHTTVEQTAQILKEYLGLDYLIKDNPTFEDVEMALAGGNLIVMTFDGKQLGNPNYKNGGPIYHAMVIKGYKAGNKIITHDVGTRRGEDYVYKWETIQNALHDWAEPVSKGAKKMIVVLPPVLNAALTPTSEVKN